MLELLHQSFQWIFRVDFLCNLGNSYKHLIHGIQSPYRAPVNRVEQWTIFELTLNMKIRQNNSLISPGKKIIHTHTHTHTHIKGSSVDNLQWHFSSPVSFPVLLGFILCHKLSLVLPTRPSPFCPQPINPLSYFLGVVCQVSGSLPMPPPPLILKVSTTFVLALAWPVSRLRRVTQSGISVDQWGRWVEPESISTLVPSGLTSWAVASPCQRLTV